MGEQRFRSGGCPGIFEMPVKDWKYGLNSKAFIIDRVEKFAKIPR